MSANAQSLPVIIQGGMGVAVSNWTLARAVSLAGQLGVVSGTALSTVLTRRLQDGDPGGIVRGALDALPLRDLAKRVQDQYFRYEGKAPQQAYRANPMPALAQRFGAELAIAANFVEVHLAKRGHRGLVGLNLLEKIQIPTLPSLFGAMLAGVDYVLMGAGIPRSIPRILDQLANNEPVELKIDALGALPDERFVDTFDPRDHGFEVPSLKRPAFLAIVSSDTLAKTLATRSEGRIDGLVVETYEAGGHNAPPRGPLQLTEAGEPLFGPRDIPNLQRISDLGLPFWLAGSYGRPGKLAAAQALGAVGIQVGTAFAYCDESGLAPHFKADAIEKSRRGEINVFTDPHASPTGFPFKVLQARQTLSESEIYTARKRVCDLGYLRSPYRRGDGSLGYRCAAEPVDDYVNKGGRLEDTVGRKCVCNGLLAAIGLPQTRHGNPEPALLTTGQDAKRLHHFLPSGKSSYNANDVIEKLLEGAPTLGSASESHLMAPRRKRT